MDKHKANKLQRVIGAEDKQLLPGVTVVAKQAFNCKEDAQAELERPQRDQTKVEQGFGVFITGKGSLSKNPDRVGAFGYLAIIALIVASVFHHRVRTRLRETKRTTTGLSYILDVASCSPKIYLAGCVGISPNPA